MDHRIHILSGLQECQPDQQQSRDSPCNKQVPDLPGHAEIVADTDEAAAAACPAAALCQPHCETELPANDASADSDELAAPSETVATRKAGLVDSLQASLQQQQQQQQQQQPDANQNIAAEGMVDQLPNNQTHLTPNPNHQQQIPLACLLEYLASGINSPEALTETGIDVQQGTKAKGRKQELALPGNAPNSRGVQEAEAEHLSTSSLAADVMIGTSACSDALLTSATQQPAASSLYETDLPPCILSQEQAATDERLHDRATLPADPVQLVAAEADSSVEKGPANISTLLSSLACSESLDELLTPSAASDSMTFTRDHCQQQLQGAAEDVAAAPSNFLLTAPAVMDILPAQQPVRAETNQYMAAVRSRPTSMLSTFKWPSQTQLPVPPAHFISCIRTSSQYEAQWLGSRDPPGAAQPATYSVSLHSVQARAGRKSPAECLQLARKRRLLADVQAHVAAAAMSPQPAVHGHARMTLTGSRKPVTQDTGHACALPLAGSPAAAAEQPAKRKRGTAGKPEHTKACVISAQKLNSPAAVGMASSAGKAAQHSDLQCPDLSPPALAKGAGAPNIPSGGPDPGAPVPDAAASMPPDADRDGSRKYMPYMQRTKARPAASLLSTHLSTAGTSKVNQAKSGAPPAGKPSRSILAIRKQFRGAGPNSSRK